ncbi:hypothetical protein DPMN_118325 [Dreissena polymorpha]|uniref:Uncharacterized protein n=1 Tax=Dreissena polymorpha TaxID=45954 RepID=A0A9D4JQZ9_DREPO|nr:hypothetical protein DPMN_118325 [Dreissena polymorpha]
MRDDDKKSSFSQVCCVLPRIMRPWEGMSTLLHCPSRYSSSGFDVDLPLVCSGEQSRTDNRAC